MAPTTRSRNPPAPPQAQGNLETVLTSYDHSHKNPNQPSSQFAAPGSLTINVPTATNDGGDDRGRSDTLGSFDLHSIVMGKDGRGMSFSGLMTPGVDHHADGMSEGTSTTAVSGSTSSTHGAQAASNADLRLPNLPEHRTTPKTANIPVHNTRGQAARERGDSTASQFINGLYQQPLPQHQQMAPGQMISHTPPTQMGTSYENKHFGKRMRAGSISGRLRSASDLEDTGMISREQKAILKDLLIAGDSSVQGAIDKYEAGDSSALEGLIKSGAFAKSADVDLLGDLDLDFLNMGAVDDGMMFGNMEDIGSAGGKQAPGAGDGIGDLEFNGVDLEPEPVASSHPPMVHRPRGDSIDDINLHRMRANSLALPGSLLDGAHGEDPSHVSYGRWMDKTPHLPGSSHQQFAPHGGGRGHHGLRPPQFASECDVLMASKFRGNSRVAPPQVKKSSKPKKEKAKTKKEKKDQKKDGPRERKSQARMKGMMEGITSSKEAGEEEDDKEVESGLGRPRSMSDPNLSVRLDDHGLLNVKGPEGWVGAYSPTSREIRINRFLEKRNHRVWTKKVKYDVRKSFADSRLRVKGRFVKKEDEMLMRELMSLT